MTIKVKFVLRDHRGDWMDETTVDMEFVPRVDETVHIFDRPTKVSDVHHVFGRLGDVAFRESVVYLDSKY